MEVSRFIGIVEGLQAVYLRVYYEMNEFSIDSDNYQRLKSIRHDIEKLLDKIMEHVKEDNLRFRAPGE
jgi:hypothetical protein